MEIINGTLSHKKKKKKKKKREETTIPWPAWEKGFCKIPAEFRFLVRPSFSFWTKIPPPLVHGHRLHCRASMETSEEHNQRLREQLKYVTRVVVKAGTSIVSDPGYATLHHDFLRKGCPSRDRVEEVLGWDLIARTLSANRIILIFFAMHFLCIVTTARSLLHEKCIYNCLSYLLLLTNIFIAGTRAWVDWARSSSSVVGCRNLERRLSWYPGTSYFVLPDYSIPLLDLIVSAPIVKHTRHTALHHFKGIWD